jgi:cellulose synthase/poly-beta-1,6-N-acetylglucosamine synthase-like glycosyltransferase
MLFTLLLLLHLALLYFLLFPFLTVLLAGMRKEENPPKATEEADIACIITAYKHADISIPLVESLLRQQYQHYHIYLVADQCEVAHLGLTHERLHILKPGQALNSKVRSIKHAISHFARQHSHILIFDPDNLAPANFLSEMNRWLQAGYPAVQGERVAKNLDSLYACLDATGEMYYNYAVRYVPWRLGASSTISGSGMAVRTDLFEAYLGIEEMDTEKHEVILAEDKILQIDLIRRDTRIAYAKEAILYDEKVTEGQQVERQRTRWIKSYFEHLSKAWGLVGRGLRRPNRNQLIFGLFISLLPMFMMVGGVVVLLGLDLLAWAVTGSQGYLGLMLSLIIGGGIFVANFLLVLKLAQAPAEIWRSLWGVPAFIFRQVKALLKLKKSRNDFLVTSHKKAVKIEELEQKPDQNRPKEAQMGE